MDNFILTSCSTADMPVEYFTQRNIPYACLHFHLDGEEYPDDIGVTIPFPDFYARIESGALPTTSQVNPNEFINLFEPFLSEGKDILHISFSSGLSGTYNSAILAKEELSLKYPDRKLIVIDSLAASSGLGLLLDMAADMRDQGHGIEEIAAWVENNKLNINHFVLSTDLTHLKRGGRISATSAFVGTKLSICPMIYLNHKGNLIPFAKVRGKKNAIAELLRKMENNALECLNYKGKCFISHSECYEDAKHLAELVEAKFPNLAEPVSINYIGTVIGSHTGKGTIAIFFVGKKRVS
ncbi:MAG: DegV family protein [Syntrophomonadaceae bacterium]|jgi:DegV family protein with EDD domain|nr:DegV family protein [Syntrophomonadaceae bacterium]